MTLSPGEVRTISLADYQQAGQIPPDAAWGTLKLAYTGRRADLVAVAVSYDKTNRYGLQTPFSEDLSRLWAGGMWHVDATHNTLITTGNAGAESTTAEVTLFYNGGKSKYRLEKMLPPGQQLWLDIGRLIHDQIPDSDGSTLEPDTMTGSYELRDLDHQTVGQLYEGKLVIDKTYGHAAYGCGTCCGYGVPTLLPDPFSGPPGINNNDVMQSLEQCGGDLVDLADDAYNWSSSNTAVATLPTKTLHTVAVGSATGTGTVYVQADKPAPRCPMAYHSPQQPVTVGQPMTLVGVSCLANPTYPYIGNYNNIGTMCFMNAVIPVPSGGVCVNSGTTPQGTPKQCYQTNVKGCSTTYCVVNNRTADSACMQFLDQNGYTVTKLPGGCN